METWFTACMTSTRTYTMYLTGCSTEETRTADRADLGVLCTPDSGIHGQRRHYEVWAADNGCFMERHPVKPSKFTVDGWLSWLDKLTPDACAFVTLPDVLNWEYVGTEVQGADKHGYVPVGDMAATWERSKQYAEHVRALGFPVAVVLQNGIESMPELWAEILAAVDAIFIGGSDDFKLGVDVARLVCEAKAAGKWVHVGRVNSWKRMSYCSAIGADSADGTFIGFGPRKNAPKVMEWLDKLAGQTPPQFVARELVAA